MLNYNIIDENELKRRCEQFNADYGLSMKINYTFKERFQSILESDKSITAKEFADRTGYDINRFYRMKRGEPTSMETFVAFCVAFDISIQNAVDMLRSLGVAFNPTEKLHCAYCYLISECRGKTLIECNEILQGFGIDKLLGDF